MMKKMKKNRRSLFTATEAFNRQTISLPPAETLLTVERFRTLVDEQMAREIKERIEIPRSLSQGRVAIHFPTTATTYRFDLPPDAKQLIIRQRSSSSPANFILTPTKSTKPHD